MKIGEKYYIIKDNKLLVLRVKKLGQEVTVVLDNGQKFKINKDVLENQYTLLKPHGSIFFNIVNLYNTTNDVIVTLFRDEDIKTDGIPYAVCRQNITDFLAMNVVNIQMAHGHIVENKQYIGISLSKDTCSDDIPYQIMMACDGFQMTEEVAIYLDDTLDIILSLVNKTVKYNTVLQQLYSDSQKLELLGCNKNIKDLLSTNDFMLDFERGYKIYRTEFKLEFNEENTSLEREQQRYFEQLLNVNMMNTYVFEYSYTIDVNKIEREYILVRDLDSRLFILAYDKGEYLDNDVKKIINIAKDIKNSISK